MSFAEVATLYLSQNLEFSCCKYDMTRFVCEKLVLSFTSHGFVVCACGNRGQVALPLRTVLF